MGNWSNYNRQLHKPRSELVRQGPSSGVEGVLERVVRHVGEVRRVNVGEAEEAS